MYYYFFGLKSPCIATFSGLKSMLCYILTFKTRALVTFLGPEAYTLIYNLGLKANILLRSRAQNPYIYYSFGLKTHAFVTFPI